MEFVYEDGEMKINFFYSAKDFVATYDSAFGEMKYALHLMFMCPWKYTEEMLREKQCKNVAEEFRALEKLLTDNSKYIDEKRKKLNEKLELLNAKREGSLQNRREMKKQLKEGLISEIEYQRFCKEVKDIDFDIRKEKSNFFHEIKAETGADLRLLKECREGENNV